MEEREGWCSWARLLRMVSLILDRAKTSDTVIMFARAFGVLGKTRGNECRRGVDNLMGGSVQRCGVITVISCRLWRMIWSRARQARQGPSERTTTGRQRGEQRQARPDLTTLRGLRQASVPAGLPSEAGVQVLCKQSY